MIRCSNCSGSNLVGAAFCRECGSLLDPAGVSGVQGIKSTSRTGPSQAGSPTNSGETAPGTWAMLHFPESGAAIPLAGRDEFIMGRSTEHQPSAPDIDLSPYQGYGSGVSRLHAKIRRQGNQVVLIDLDSANGTYLNGKRIGTLQEEALVNGDVIVLGKLKIQFRLQAN